MPTTTHRNEKVSAHRESHGLDDVIGAGAACDQGGAPVDGAVPDAASFVVALLTGAQQSATEALAETIHGRG